MAETRLPPSSSQSAVSLFQYRYLGLHTLSVWAVLLSRGRVTANVIRTGSDKLCTAYALPPIRPRVSECTPEAKVKFVVVELCERTAVMTRTKTEIRVDKNNLGEKISIPNQLPTPIKCID